MSDNDLGPEGARALSESLGKLTALQQLNLGSKIFILVWFLFCEGSCVAVEGARHCVVAGLVSYSHVRQ